TYTDSHQELHSFPTRRSSDLKSFASPRPLRPNTHCMAGHTPKPTSSRLPPRRAFQVQLRLPACRPQCAWPFVLRRSVRDQIETRSEEHTSELQSRSDLVCRLL